MIVFKPLETKEEWQWIMERASPMMVKDTQGIVALDDKTGKIAGIIVMDSWTPSGCQLHFAIDNPMCIKRGLFREVSVHVHVTCGRKYLFGLIPANNEHAHKFDLKIGFKEVARVPEGYDIGIDYIVVRMSAEENPWLPEEYKSEAA